MLLYDDAEAFREDLERCLGERAEGDSWRLTVAYRDVAFDCLLARMTATVPGDWALSGERALALRFPERPKTTWNFDIEWPFDKLEALDQVPSMVMGYEAADFFEVEMEKRGSASIGGRVWRRFNAEVSLAGQPLSTG